MGHRVSLGQMMRDKGAETAEERDELLMKWASDSVVPALCSDGCQVEPDGTCPHGHPSAIMVALSLGLGG